MVDFKAKDRVFYLKDKKGYRTESSTLKQKYILNFTNNHYSITMVTKLCVYRD